MVVNGETAWGNTEIHISPNGDMVEIVSANTANQHSNFASTMSSSSSSPGGAEGQNMFSDGAKAIMDMLKRLSPQAQQNGKKLIEKANRSSSRTKASEQQMAVVKGQKPKEDIGTPETPSGAQGAMLPITNPLSDYA